MSEPVYLAGAVRTPIGKFGGSFAAMQAAELGRHAATAAIERAGLSPDRVDQTIFGHARQAGCGPNPARQVSLLAGIPEDRPAYTINQACLSGMQAIMGASRAVRLGEARVVLAGGMEAMSRIPYLLDARWGYRMGHQPAVDAMMRDGYLDPNCDKLMGQTAETLARKYDISREEQDAYAARSQNRCEAARRSGRFRDEIVPVEVQEKRGSREVIDDEHPRDGVTPESLKKLRPAFEKDGSVTAANSSGITDGASAMLVLDAASVEELGVRPMARLHAFHVDAVAPEIMGISPVPAVRKLLERTGHDLDGIELIELNEAFAAQALAVDRELKFDHERLNVNGGAIALGHPSGCTGNRIVVTLLHEMQRRDAQWGLATLCVSGGMGGAMLLERF
ncbi:MAG: acetyl-CoA C-acetyltransferase [bacterium]|nr:acetyl-CoA C-acetyltransferase [bacterium]